MKSMIMILKPCSNAGLQSVNEALCLMRSLRFTGDRIKTCFYSDICFKPKLPQVS